MAGGHTSQGSEKQLEHPNKTGVITRRPEFNTTALPDVVLPPKERQQAGADEAPARNYEKWQPIDEL